MFAHNRFPSLLLIVLTLSCTMFCTMGCTSRTTDDPAAALRAAEDLHTSAPDSVKAYEDLLRKAIHLAERQQEWCTCARAYLLLSAQLQWTNEQEAFALAEQAQQAVAKSHANKDELRLLQQEILLAKAGLYEQTEDTARARSFYYQCLSDSATRNVALGHLANLSLAEGNTAEALRLARQMTFGGYDSLSLEPYFILANCYLQCDSLTQAHQIYTHLLSYPNSKTRYAAQRHLTEIAIQQQSLSTLPSLVDSAFSSAEAVFFEALQQKEEYFRATLEQEHRAERLVYHQRLAAWVLAGVVMLALLTVAFLITLSRHRRQMQAQRLRAEQQERELAEERLAQQAQKIQLLQRFILDKSEVLQRLRQEGDHKKQISQKEWLDVEQMLDSTTDGFVNRLRTRHPEFREEDIQLCMLTRMNLSNQVISNIYLITVSAVKHRKLKLKKEGFGECDPERPLDDVLLSI